MNSAASSFESGRGDSRRTREALLSGVMHDLANVLMPAELLALHVRDRLPAESDLRGQLGAVGEAIARASALSSKLLLYVGLAGERAIAVDLGSLVRDVVRLLESAPRDGGGTASGEPSRGVRETQFGLEMPRRLVWVKASPVALLELLCELGRTAAVIRREAGIRLPVEVRLLTSAPSPDRAECQFAVAGPVDRATLRRAIAVARAADPSGLAGDYRGWSDRAGEWGARLSLRRTAGARGEAKHETTRRGVICALSLPRELPG